MIESADRDKACGSEEGGASAERSVEVEERRNGRGRVEPAAHEAGRPEACSSILS